MKTRIPAMALALAALAGCEDPYSSTVNEEMFVSPPPSPTETVTVLEPAAPVEIGPDGRPLDPALALVEEDPYDQTIEGGADGLTERLPDTCKLEEYQRFRGLTEADVAAAGLGVDYRIVAPNSIVTQEYNPLRVNFYTDGSGTISQIACG